MLSLLLCMCCCVHIVAGVVGDLIVGVCYFVVTDRVGRGHVVVT